MSVREKLIQVAQSVARCGEDHNVYNMDEVIDAVLVALGEPDEALGQIGAEAAHDNAMRRDYPNQYCPWSKVTAKGKRTRGHDIERAFAAMIDHLRGRQTPPLAVSSELPHKMK